MTGAATDSPGGRTDRMAQMEAIVAEHETALLRYATRLVNSPTAAQDVVQNVFVKLFRGWDRGTRPSAKLKGWLYRVTHNEAVDLIVEGECIHGIAAFLTKEKPAFPEVE